MKTLRTLFLALALSVVGVSNSFAAMAALPSDIGHIIVATDASGNETTLKSRAWGSGIRWAFYNPADGTMGKAIKKSDIVSWSEYVAPVAQQSAAAPTMEVDTSMVDTSMGDDVVSGGGGNVSDSDSDEDDMEVTMTGADEKVEEGGLSDEARARVEAFEKRFNALSPEAQARVKAQAAVKPVVGGRAMTDRHSSEVEALEKNGANVGVAQAVAKDAQGAGVKITTLEELRTFVAKVYNQVVMRIPYGSSGVIKATVALTVLFYSGALGYSFLVGLLSKSGASFVVTSAGFGMVAGWVMSLGLGVRAASSYFFPASGKPDSMV